MKLFVAAKAVVQNEEGKVLILREATTYEESTNVGKYDIPGGRRIYFACQALSSDVAVSDDHDVFEWIDLADRGEFALVSDAAKAIATLKGK